MLWVRHNFLVQDLFSRLMFLPTSLVLLKVELRTKQEKEHVAHSKDSKTIIFFNSLS